ncbi:MAG: lipid-A-disaccharide synthase, partial [Bradyrhizobium sp.]|nr:lipid-A-disaccharide synthase [Bradyrhizobium sp.]
MTRALEVSIIAGEESGDRLGAPLMRALAARYDGRVNFSGVGGREMAKEGLVSLFPIDELAIMGFAAIVRRVPLIVRRMRETTAAIVTVRPDVLVIIDSPDFTHRVARKVRAAMPSIPIVDYVSPSVWAWRPWRARSMRAYVDHILALLPFEPAVHTRLGGPACSYVGHPLVESASALRPNAEEAARRFADPPVLLVLPGSRTGEVRRLLSIFAQTIDLIRRRYGPLEIVIPTVPHLLATIREATAAWPVPPRIVMDAEEKHAA